MLLSAAKLSKTIRAFSTNWSVPILESADARIVAAPTITAANRAIPEIKYTLPDPANWFFLFIIFFSSLARF
jgi:hypothetical protein